MWSEKKPEYTIKNFRNEEIEYQTDQPSSLQTSA